MISTIATADPAMPKWQQTWPVGTESKATPKELKALLGHISREFSPWKISGISKAMVERSYCIERWTSSMRFQVSVHRWPSSHHQPFHSKSRQLRVPGLTAGILRLLASGGSNCLVPELSVLLCRLRGAGYIHPFQTTGFRLGSVHSCLR